MVPVDCRYTKEHEWVKVASGVATVGVTDYAQQALGDITFIELPAVGRRVAPMEEFAAVESVKAASDIYAPIGGTVAEVNDALTDDPGLLNQDPHGQGWLCKLKDIDPSQLASLLSAEQYEALLKEL